MKNAVFWDVAPCRSCVNRRFGGTELSNVSMSSLPIEEHYVRFEVFTAVTMKNAVFWDVAPCSSCVNRRFGGTELSNVSMSNLPIEEHYVRFEVFTAMTMKNAVVWDVVPCSSCVNRPAHAGSSLADFSTMKMEAIRSSEPSVHTRTARRHIPENGILHGSKSSGSTKGE
jgi:hypothetical protein